MTVIDRSDTDAPIRILHVDDEPDLADLTATFLEREDDRFIVETATSAEEGIRRLEETTFDCIVSDHEMPGMAGIEFLETVRESDPDLPFILFTGRGSEEVASDAISVGVSDYLQKSPGREQYELLANRIAAHVERTRGKRERKRQLDAIETAREGISILDDEGRFVYVNQAYADLYGYEPDAMVGEHWSFLYRDEDIDAINETVLPEVAEIGYWRGETVGLRADGTTFIEDHLVSETDDGGLVCTVRDVTEQKQHEQELRRYKVIVEAIDDAIYVVDQEERLEYVNDSYAALKGVSRSELIGTPLARWVDDEVLESTRQMAAEIAAGDRSIGTIEYEFRTADGESIPAELRFTTLEFPDGQQGRVGVIRDIRTRRNRAEELERYETILEAVGDPVYAADRDGCYTFVNDAYLEQPFISQQGLTRADLIGTHAAEILSDSTAETVREEILDLIADENRNKTTIETKREAPDGTTYDMETHIALLPPDEDGRFRGTAGVIRDITQRKERERELERVWERLKLALGGTRAWLWEVDLDTAEAIQIAVSGLLEGDEEHIVRPVGNFHDSLHPDDRERVSEAFWRVAEEEGEYHEEYRLPFEDDYRWIESRGCFYAGPGERADRMIGIAMDVTDRKIREQELERQNERLEEFASIVSHDLRNPLTVARGRMELAIEECPTEHLDAVDRAHRRMERLIDSLLALAKSGQQVDVEKPVDLERVCTMCWHNVDTGPARIEVDVDRRIMADPARFQQLLENLYRNSIEHGGTSVRVTVGTTATGLYIADDGPGIPVTERDRIFEFGYSGEDGGTGLGLSIVKDVVEAHGWEIEVRESEAGGVRFDITGVEFVD